MDKLPDDVLLQILSRLDNSVDVARCRVASKAFDAVFPGLRSINLRSSCNWYSRASISSSYSYQRIKPLKPVFLDLISKLKTVESVCIDLYSLYIVRLRDDDFSLTDGDVAKEWLPKVSGSLRSLLIYDFFIQRESNVLPLISTYCHNLVNLELKCAWLSRCNLNPMPMLTSLTLDFTRGLEDEHLNDLNNYFPNLQVLNLRRNSGLKDPKIHHLNLKTCHVATYEYEYLQSLTLITPTSSHFLKTCHVATYEYEYLQSLTLITPNLITLRFDHFMPTIVTLNVEAPMLSHFHLDVRFVHHRFGIASFLNKFENMRTLWLRSYYISSLLSQLPITKTVEDLTLNSEDMLFGVPRDSEFILGKVFAVFPNVTSLRINSAAWLQLEACLNPEGWEICDGRKRLRKNHAYLKSINPSLTFSFVACVLDQCVGLLEVSLLIHVDVVGPVSKGFMSKCMARWPGLKWRWGTWSEFTEDSWITNSVSN